MDALRARVCQLEEERSSRYTLGSTIAAPSLRDTGAASSVAHPVSVLDIEAFCRESESIIQRVVESDGSEEELREATEDSLKHIRGQVAANREEEQKFWQSLRLQCVARQHAPC